MAFPSSKAVRAGLARPSGWILVAVNLALIVAVLGFGWSVFDIIFLYWAENLVIGAINVLKMATATGLAADEKTLRERGGSEDEIDQANTAMQVANLGIKLFMIPFFIVHYGGFCFGHGVFVIALFDESGQYGDDLLTAVPALITGGLAFSLAALAISHLYSFFSNYLGRGEYLRTNPAALMMRPYGRIVALHITIILGGFLVMALDDPTWMLLVLVVLKTAVDLAMHGQEREKFSPDGA